MPFKKGHSGNPAGRKKGAPNKSTKEIREVITGIISRSFDESKILKDINSLSPKQRLDYYIRLLDFILAKPKSIEPESEKPLTMNEKYSRITEYIKNNFNTSQDKNDKPRRGSLVKIGPTVPEVDYDTEQDKLIEKRRRNSL